MGAKKKQRSKNVTGLYRDEILSILWRQKMQDMKFEELLKQGIIKEAVMIKIYICASFPRREEAQRLAIELPVTMKIVSTWHRDDLKSVSRTSEECLHRVLRDFNQIRESDIIIVLIGDNLSGGGRHTELGIALGMGKNIKLIGGYDYNPFELIPRLRIYESTDALVEEFASSQKSMQAEYEWCNKQAKLNSQE